MSAMQSLSAFDPNSLNRLKSLARTEGNSPEVIRDAARQFEGLFLQMMLKAMRDATPQDGLFNNDQTRLFQSLLDQQLALDMAQKGGIGLADVLYRQLGGPVEPLVKPTEKGFPLFDLEAESRGFDLSGVPVSSAEIFAVPSFSRQNLSEEPDEIAAWLIRKRDENQMSEARLAAQLDHAIKAAQEINGTVSNRAQAFVNQVWPYALEASRKTGIPPHFMVAQAALETGWGEKVLRHADGRPSYNLFNIKAGNQWHGATVEVAVDEYAAGQKYTEQSRFRSYGSYAEAFNDYAALLADNPRYALVLGQTDAAGFARSLQQAGYATDPMYADKLTRIIGGNTLRNALAAG